MSSASDAVRAAGKGKGKKGLVRRWRTKSREGTVTAKPSLWRPNLSDCVDLSGGGGDLGGSKAKILVVLLLLGTIGYAADPSTTHHESRVVSERRSRRQRDQHHLGRHPRDFNVTQTLQPRVSPVTPDPELRLRVLNLNMWGLNWPLGLDHEPRFRALRQILARGDFDVVLLQEVWFRWQYDILRTAMPFASHFDSYNACSGTELMPLECSGLVVMSRHPIQYVQFQPFTRRGYLFNFDGEIFARKGLASARILFHDLTVDVFTSHFASYRDDPKTNSIVRRLQTLETATAIRHSDADVKVFGGDINALPAATFPGVPYNILTSVMTDACAERFPGGGGNGGGARMHPVFDTYGNRRNSYTGDSTHNGRIDYLMYTAKGRPGLRVYTKEFKLPRFTWRSSTTGRHRISISDHEPLLADFAISRRYR